MHVHKYLLFLPIALYSTGFHSKKKPSAQVVHIRRDTHSAQNIVTLCASPCSVQESAQEIMVVHKLKTLGNYPVSFCVQLPNSSLTSLATLAFADEGCETNRLLDEQKLLGGRLRDFFFFFCTVCSHLASFNIWCVTCQHCTHWHAWASHMQAMVLIGDAKQAMSVGERKSGPGETGLTGPAATALLQPYFQAFPSPIL